MLTTNTCLRLLGWGDRADLEAVDENGELISGPPRSVRIIGGPAISRKEMGTAFSIADQTRDAAGGDECRRHQHAKARRTAGPARRSGLVTGWLSDKSSPRPTRRGARTSFRSHWRRAGRSGSWMNTRSIPALGTAEKYLVTRAWIPGRRSPVKAVTAGGGGDSDSGVDAEPRRRTGGHPGRCGRLRFLPGQAALVVLRGDIQHENLPRSGTSRPEAGGSSPISVAMSVIEDFERLPRRSRGSSSNGYRRPRSVMVIDRAAQ